MSTQLMGRRLRLLREKRNLSQSQLARVSGIGSQQTVSAIERGTQDMTAEQLAMAIKGLNVSLDELTDSFRLVGEGQFSWRGDGIGAEPDLICDGRKKSLHFVQDSRVLQQASMIEASQLGHYEKKAGSWIAAYRELTLRVGRSLPLIRYSLNLSRNSNFEDVMQAGERFVQKFELGDRPAAYLAELIQEEFGILVLTVDIGRSISSAVCHLSDLDAVLLSHRLPDPQRNFELAHALFHILTWDAMPPKNIVNMQSNDGGRVDKLASKFARSLLIPEPVLRRYEDWWKDSRGKHLEWLAGEARNFDVTIPVLAERLTDLGLLGKVADRALSSVLRNYRDHGFNQAASPPRYSRPFMEVIGLAVKHGFVSVRRTAALLDLTVDDLPAAFASHDVEYSVDL